VTDRPVDGWRSVAGALAALLVAAVVAAVVAAGVASAAPGGGAHPGARSGAVRLASASSAVNGLALSGAPDTTWWAHPVYRAVLRRHPSNSAPRVSRLHLFTEDGFSEVDLISAEALDGSGEIWLEIEEPAKPAPIVGWAPATAFTWPTSVRTRLVVDRVHLRAILYRAGRVVWQAPIGVGKPSTPTPGGRIWVREKFTVPGDGLYGTRAFGTSGHSAFLTDWPNGAVIGIHGTDQPWLIPGRVSHGCIRVRNPDVERLYALMPIGTPIVVL
jgi:hypothetical protein